MAGEVRYRVSFRINPCAELKERARVEPARVLARKDSSTRKNRYSLARLGPLGLTLEAKGA